MKRALSVLFLSIVMLTWAVAPGCALFQGKSPDVAAVNASDAAKITVEVALRAWNDYIPVGRPSLEHQRRVKAAYQQYKTAQLALLDAALVFNLAKQSGTPTPEQEANMNAAAVAASNALANVVSLVRQFGAKI